VQFLCVKQFLRNEETCVRRQQRDGWAHYSEQMMVEEGFGGGDLKVHLAQLSEALLRDCRYVAGIKLYTHNITVEQAAKLFVEKRFPGASRRVRGSAPRDVQSYVPLLQTRKVADLQIARHVQAHERISVHARTISF
jgi:hypothetical protein